MRYSLLAGGKRIRPVLTLAAARALGGDPAERAADRGRDRAGAHLLADPRRPAGDGRRRPAPRAADLPHRLRRERRDPGRRRADGGGLPADPRAPGRRAGAACWPRCGSCPTRSASTGWWAASTSTSPATRSWTAIRLRHMHALKTGQADRRRDRRGAALAGGAGRVPESRLPGSPPSSASCSRSSTTSST